MYCIGASVLSVLELLYCSIVFDTLYWTYLGWNCFIGVTVLELSYWRSCIGVRVLEFARCGYCVGALLSVPHAQQLKHGNSSRDNRELISNMLPNENTMRCTDADIKQLRCFQILW